MNRKKYYKIYDEKRKGKRKLEYINDRKNRLKIQIEYDKKSRLRRYNERKKLFKIMGNKCICCKITEWWNLTIDHIKPLNDTKKRISPAILIPILLKNRILIKKYQILCFGCNTSKHTGKECVLIH